MTDLTKQLPVEILSKIFKSLSLQDLSTVVLVCRRWREVGETPKLWSQVTVTVDERNQDIVSEILSSRRMEALSKYCIVMYCTVVYCTVLCCILLYSMRVVKLYKDDNNY